VRGGDYGSDLTGRRPLLGIAGGAEPLKRDLDAEPDDEDGFAIRRGSQEQRDTLAILGCGGGISRMG
jgi:hypothetical protein